MHVSHLHLHAARQQPLGLHHLHYSSHPLWTLGVTGKRKMIRNFIKKKLKSQIRQQETEYIIQPSLSSDIHSKALQVTLQCGSGQVKQRAGVTWSPKDSDNGKRHQRKPGRFQSPWACHANPSNTSTHNR